MKILITGATGFLGGHLARRLLERGHNVRAFGRNSEECAALEKLDADVVRADLRDENVVVEACRGIEVVCHAGALSSAWGAKSEFFDINVQGTANVLRGCKQFGVRRFVYVSSSSVLFDGRSHRNVNESAPLPKRFASIYSLSKKLGEDLTRDAQSENLETVIIRPKALFGPGDPALLPRVIRAAREGKLVQVGQGRNELDLTFIDNAVDALVLGLERPNIGGRLFHISGGEPIRLWPLLKDVLRRLGLPHELKVVPFRLVYALAFASELRAILNKREPVLTRFGVSLLARTQTFDISLARRELGYEPRVSVQEGIERTLQKFKLDV